MNYEKSSIILVITEMGLRELLRQQNLFIRLMAPYGLFILFALLLGWVFYNQTFHIIEDEVTQNNLHLLNQVKGTLDERFAEINRIAFQQLNDPRIQNFQRLTDPFESTATYKVIETQKSLFGYGISNNFLLDYFLVFKNSELVLSYNSTYELPLFYQYMLSYPGVEYENWINDLFGTYRNGEILFSGMTSYQGKESDIITYVHTLGYPNRIQGALLVLVRNEKLHSLLKRIDTAEGGVVAIFDSKDRLITSLPIDSTTPIPSPSILKGSEGIVGPSHAVNDMMITYSTSAYNGWHYVVAQHPNIVLNRLIAINRIMIALFLAFLAGGIVLAYEFARYNGRPLKDLIFNTAGHEVEGFRRLKDMYVFVENEFSSLRSDNAELKKEIEKQAPLLWESFFNRMLKGDFSSEMEIDSLLLHQRVQINGTSYLVGILQFRLNHHNLSSDSLHTLDVERVLVKEELRKAIEDVKFMYDIAEDQIALLFINRKEDQTPFSSMVEKRMTEILFNIENESQLELRFALGDPRFSLIELPGSYEEARQSLFLSDYGEKQKRIVRFSELSKENTIFDFSSELENRLSNFVKAGETKELETLLQRLFSVNFLERNLSLSMSRLLLSELVGCLVKLRDKTALPDSADINRLLLNIDNYEEPRNAFDDIANCFLSISVRMDQQKKSRNTRLLEKIMSYVTENYVNPNLCLDEVSDQLCVSKGYLSQFFKEQTGINLSDYIENMRLDVARDLLAETSIPIGDIAEQIGYRSTNTFCRAFRRGCGISATKFRQNAEQS